jgi:hypothetical protein
MSLAFYDRNGRPYAYSDDGEHIFTFGGRPVGYLANGSIYRFDGRHVGRFESGLLRDSSGSAILFTQGAVGGPMKPMRSMLPMKSMKQMKPMKGMRQMTPMRPMSTMSWSSHDPAALFES